jgi:hypothetical protein
MANEIDKPIESLDTEWEGYLGSRIEAYLKQFLQNLDSKKHGDWLLTSDDNGLTTLRAFADTDSKEAYEKDPTANESLVLASVQFYSSGATSADYTLSTRITQNPDTDMVKGSSNVLKFTYNCYYGGDTTDLDPQNGYAKVTINNTEVSELSLSLAAGGNEYAIDLGKYLTQETNTVKLEVGNQHGKSRTWTFTIRALEIVLSLADGYDESVLHSADVNGWMFRVRCSGVTALVHLMVDGEEVATSTITNSTNDFTIDSDGSLAGGVHTIAVYAENTEYGITTDTITTRFIKAGLTTPSVCIGRNSDTSVKLYGTASIAYFLHDPNNAGNTVTVRFGVYSPLTGELLFSPSTQSITLAADGTSGMQEVRITAGETSYLDLGQLNVDVLVGDATASTTLLVADAGVTLEAASECKVYLSAVGRTNADSDAQNWHSEYNGQTTCIVKYSDNLQLNSSNGFINDTFVVKAGKYITLDGFYPFATDCGANATAAADKTGKTIELELQAQNCVDADTKIAECLYNNVGFVLYANRIELYCGTSGKIETIYSDEQRVRVGFCIDGTTTTCVNQLVGKDPETTYANIAYIYLNGVIVRMADYKSATWRQSKPQPITIGSEDCDVVFYTARCYDKSLNYRQMMGNYAYDTPNLDDKIAIAQRNDILNSSSEVDFNKVLTALPNTPYKIWEMETTPPDKKTYVPCNTEFVNPAWDNGTDTSDLARASFTCTNHGVSLDGTSSLSYPDPYKNWADHYMYYNNTQWQVNFPDGTKLTITGYAIANGVTASAQEFVDKVNFASSEGIFNILTANAYHNILLSTAKVYPNLLTEKQAAQQAAGQDITYRQSLSGFPEIGYLRTYNNGAASLRFLSIYNFINNKYDPYYFGMDNSGEDEAWEVEDNVNFFSEELAEGEWVNGEWVDRATELYYARFPRYSPDGTGRKYGVAKSETQVDLARSETQWLRRFHNWVYSCNPTIAKRYYLKTEAETGQGEYRRLAQSVTYGSVTYDRDTPEYRIAKFNAEYADYLVKESALFYFIYFTYTLGTDSMDKNMTIVFENTASGKPLARFAQRDSDTGFRYNNSGALTFKVYHEWGDSYDSGTETTGVVSGETYNGSTYSVVTTAGEAVFNGRLSGLWDCVAQAWGSDINTMYAAMQTAGLNESDMWSLYNSFWSQWCEALYNADGMGYANTGKFDMAHGDKREVMRHYLKYRQRYFDSKCGANNSKPLEFRLWGSAVGNGLCVKYAYPLYASMNWGAGGINTQRAITPNSPSYFASTKGVQYTETTVTVYDADLITEISSYSEEDGVKTTHGLQDLADGGIRINNLENCKRLERLIVDYSDSATPNTQLNDNVAKISNSIALKELVICNCPNVATEIAINSEQIENVDLRDTSVTLLTVPATDTLLTVALPATLTKINFNGCRNLFDVEIQGYKNISSIVITDCPSLNPQPIVVAAIENATDLETVKITGANWSDVTADTVEKLADIGAELTGVITMASDAVVSAPLKAKMLAAWGNVDSTDNALYVSYKQIAFTSVTVSGANYYGAIGTYSLEVVPNVTNGNTFKAVKWTLAKNDYATIDTATGVITVSKVGTSDDKPSAVATVEVTMSDDTKLTASATVYFYQRDCAVGDYVYYDGTSSDILDTGKTVIGICFYINPNDKADRLMVALSDIQSNRKWGLHSNNPTLTDDPAYSCKDVAGLVNKESGSPQPNNSAYIDSSQPDGFAVVPNSKYALGELGRYAIELDLPGYATGEKLPWGRANTLKIVKHRDKILTDSGVNLPVPAATSGMSLYANLELLITAVDKQISNGNEYYYPAASLCAAYEPTVKASETLADKFRAGMWFLPSGGEAGRLLFYHAKGYDSSTENAIFAKPFAASRFSAFSNAWYWTSSSCSQSDAWFARFSSANIGNTYEGNTGAVRAVAAF